MTLSDWMFYIGIKAGHWLTPLVYIFGLVAGGWAYWLSRKAGYLFVTAYFLLVLSNVYAGPAINRAIARRWPTPSQLSPQIQEQYTQEFMALSQKYYPSGQTININFPFGPIILVSGLWILAKNESRKNSNSCVLPNTGPTTSLGDSSVGKGPPSVS